MSHDVVFYQLTKIGICHFPYPKKAVDSYGSTTFGAVNKPQVPVIQDVGGEERSFSDALGALDHGRC